MTTEVTAPAKRQVPWGNGTEPARSGLRYLPDTDIYETDDHMVLVADMPGVVPDDVDITLERRVLTIRGRIATPVHEGYRRFRTEYGEGDFERAFTLSQEIDRDRIEADYRNGVLMVKLPKAESAKTKKIEVKAA